jgi:hypothetical protein
MLCDVCESYCDQFVCDVCGFDNSYPDMENNEMLPLYIDILKYIDVNPYDDIKDIMLEFGITYKTLREILHNYEELIEN